VSSSLAGARQRLAEGLLLMQDLNGEERSSLEGFLEVAEAYGRLEVLALGGIHYELPAHLGGVEQEPSRQGETLGARERGLLGQAHEGEMDLAAALEARGIKIVTAPVASDLGSVFTYEAAIGPALFVNSRRGPSESRFWLAHAYAHLIADYDPYRTRLCREGSSRIAPSGPVDLDEWYGSSADLSIEAIAASEERANAFAEALLLPADLLATFLAGARREGGAALTPGVLLQMESYFGVAAARILRRLVRLGAMAEAVAETLAAQVSQRRAAEEPAAIPPEAVPYPRRMVDLAAGAYRQGKISIAEISNVFRSEPRLTRTLLKAYDVSRRAPEPPS
jgi:Zn-dependent peptidase ImmA (M78 family)